MKFKEWWENLLSKFGGKEEPDDGQVMELAASEAPEPVPDRKTSDETIVEMADSTLENGMSRTAAPVPEFDEWTEETAAENEDGTDGIREE